MKILEYLQSYDGPPLRFMEVCGTHTAEIHRNGIPALLPPSIELVSGPGCPVCVTVSAYIDRLIELGMNPENRIVTFGDMLRVPGSSMSLSEARAKGCSVRMAYSPMDALKLAKADPEHRYIFAAVGFETTTPVYALLVQEALEQGVTNLRLLTSLKVMPPAIDWICAHNAEGPASAREEQFGFPVKAFGRSALPLALPIENAKNINYLKNRLFSILFPVLKLNQTKKKQNRQLKKQTSKVRYSVKTGHPGYYTKNLQHKNSARPCERVAEITRYHCVLHQKKCRKKTAQQTKPRPTTEKLQI